MLDLEKKKGITRTVFLIGRYAIKFPRFTTMSIFLHGCYANWSERQYCKIFKKLPEFYDKVVPSHFCFWFGIFQIQSRAMVNTNQLTNEQYNNFRWQVGTDTKPSNFGYYKGSLRCLDYPQF